MDTFNDMTPIEPEDVVESTEGNDGLDTFDNMEPILEEPTEEEGKEEPKSTDKKDGDSQVDQLDEEEEGAKKSEEKTTEDKRPSGKEDSKEEDSESETEDDETQTDNEIPEGKAIRIKEGDKSHDLNENSTVKVKVNGKGKFVSLRELKEAYSGETAYSTKIAEANRNLEVAKVEREKAEGASAHLRDTVEGFVAKLQEKDSNPIDAIVNLLDQFGKNGHTYIRRLVETQSQLGSELSELTETEQELFWTNFENKQLQNIQASQKERLEREEAEKGLVAHVDALREKHGISEEDFIVAARELSGKVDSANLTAETVVEYIATQPHIKTVEDLTKDFIEDMDDADYEKLVADSAKVLFNYSEMDPTEAIKLAAKRLGYEIETDDDLARQIEDKQPPKKKELPKNQRVGRYSEDHIESFDDFDY